MKTIRPLIAMFSLLSACGSRVGPGETGTTEQRSCAERKPGAGPDCGVDGKTDCCASVEIPGGSFNRLNDTRYPATVSAFRMDVFEVTVGRMRAFVDAFPSSRPKAGDGAHPRVPGSGWNPDWDRFLPKTRDDLAADLGCRDDTSKKYATWTSTAGANEHMPASCMSWHEAFAFCAWDGGRLPTDAEWNYVAAGGAEQRKYPWGSAPPDPTRAVLSFTPTGHLTPVGSTPAGASKWGVLDLSGSRVEFVRDGANSSTPSIGIPVPCSDCIRMDNSPERFFMSRDRNWKGTPDLPSVVEEFGPVDSAGASVAVFGVRCVRDAH